MVLGSSLSEKTALTLFPKAEKVLFTPNQEAIGNGYGRSDYAFAHVILGEKAKTIGDVGNEDDAVFAGSVKLFAGYGWRAIVAGTGFGKGVLPMAFACLGIDAVDFTPVAQDVNFPVGHRGRGNEGARVRPGPEAVGFGHVSLTAHANASEMAASSVGDYGHVARHEMGTDDYPVVFLLGIEA